MWNSRIQYTVDHDKVVKVSMNWGLEKRPFYETLQNLEPNLAVKWADRFSAMESIAAETALAMAFEKAYGIEVPKRAEYIRTLLAELQRILWLLTTMGSFFKAVEEKPRYEQVQYLRENIFECQEILTGSRILPQMLCVGGVERDFSIGQIHKLQLLLKRLIEEYYLFFHDIESDLVLMSRLHDVLWIDLETVKKYNWSGLVGQTSGHFTDLRKDKPYSIYDKFQTQTYDVISSKQKRGDVYARFDWIRFQIRQSIRLCNELIQDIPSGNIKTLYFDELKPLDGKFSASVEAPSGEMVVTLQNKKILFSSTSTRVQPHLESLLFGVHQDDFYLALASLGFDFSQGDLL